MVGARLCSQDRGEPIGLLDSGVSISSTISPSKDSGRRSRGGFGSAEASVAEGSGRTTGTLRVEALVRETRRCLAGRHGSCRRDWLDAARVGPGGSASLPFAQRALHHVRRDDTVFRLEERFRPVMEGAALIVRREKGCSATSNRASPFNARTACLPVDFGGRFGSMDKVRALRAEVQSKRGKNAPPSSESWSSHPKGPSDVSAPAPKTPETLA